MKVWSVGVLSVVASSFVAPLSWAQGVLIGNSSSSIPNPSAILDLDVSGMTSKKGILPPRMTEGQKLEISNPATSLMVYQTDETEGYYYYDGTQWRGFGGDNLGSHKADQNLEMSGNWISADGDNEGVMITNSGNVGIGVTTPSASFHTAGSVEMDDLEGTGTRMVVADANGQLSTQPIPSGGPGSGTTLYVNATSDINNLDVTGVSFIHATSDDNNNEVLGLVGGVLNQIIYLVNTSNKDLKFKKDTGTQELIKDFDLKKEEGGMLMFNGADWQIISKH